MVFENISFELYLDDSWTSITDDIVSSNGIQLTPRIDGTFAVGTFDAWLSIEYVAAYTPLRITFNGNAYYLVCSSTSSKYLFEEGKYYHTFDIFEATALLSNFIVGSKVFSVTGTNKTDYDKIKILIELMQEKYNININYIDSITMGTFNKQREFTFGAGTTLYDALSTILADYDLIPIVTKINSSIAFTINYLNKNSDSEIQYSNNELTSVVTKQNMDNYCKYLETEASNVVDRTTETTWHNLTVRAEDILINADKAALLLPAKVEKITKITTNANNWGFKVDLNEYNNTHPFFIKGMGFTTADDDDAEPGNRGYIKNNKWNNIFDYFADYSSDDDPETKQAAKEITALYLNLHQLFIYMDGVDYDYDNFLIKLSEFKWLVELFNDNGTLLYRITASYLASSSDFYYSMMDVTSSLKEKAEWDTLDVTEKPKYMYYESGTNVIKGLHNFYKDDFWGEVTGKTVSPWYTYLEGEEYTTSLGGSTGYAQKGSEGYIPTNAIFNVTATPIVDPIIINEKSINPLTENAWKPYARSYNQKAATIEFDKLEERMQISNDSLGDVELEIEMTNPSNLPNLINTIAYKLTYKNEEYYVMAFVINIKLDMVTVRYSLSRTYSKKAEVIGVDTQFEATPNPLKNIITRPIYIKATTGANVDLDEYNYLRFTFEQKIGNQVKQSTLYKRFAILESNNTKLLYCEAIDQYTFDYNMVQAYGANYYKNPVPYVKVEPNEVSYNEVYRIYNVSLCKITAGTTTMEAISKKLPEIESGASATTITIASNILLYKDARERLTFTIKLN